MFSVFNDSSDCDEAEISEPVEILTLMLECGYLLPSQVSGLTTTLMNKFFKIKYDEEFVPNQQVLPEEGARGKYTFGNLFDSVLQKRNDPEIALDENEVLVSGG